jgi:superfamily II RNA helicase
LKWKDYLSTISNYTLSQKIASIDDAMRRQKPVGLVIDLEMRLFRLHLELEDWLEEPNRDSDVIRDRHTVSILKMVKDICQNKVLTLSAKQVLTNVLTALGFKEYVTQMFTAATYLDDQRLSFSFLKLLDSRTKSPRYTFMSIAEHPVVWQLRLFGDYMDRSMDSSPDKRVSFEPDAWQKKVLDGIDKNKSLLVVGP